MGEERDEGAWAFDVVGALKAKVDAVKEAEAALQERASELSEERETLNATANRLAEKERELSRLEEDLSRRRLGLQDGVTELERAQTALTEEQARLAANEARLREWAQSLHTVEQQVISLRDDLKARQTDVALKLAQFHDRLAALTKREEGIAARETALGQSLERLKKVSDAVSDREKVLGAQVQALGDLQKQWSEAVRRREDEFGSALSVLTEQATAQGLGGMEISSLIDGLQDEVEKIAAQRQALIARERKVVEFERSLTAVIGSVRDGIEGRSEPGSSEALTPPPTIVAAPSQPVATPEPAAEAPAAKPAPPGKTPKGRAMEKMARVLELAKRSQSAGRDDDELRELIRQLRRAYDAKTWEDVDAFSDRVLTKLDLPTPSSG